MSHTFTPQPLSDITARSLYENFLNLIKIYSIFLYTHN